MNRSHTFQTIRLQQESESDSLLSGRQPVMNVNLQSIQHLMSFSLSHLHLSCLSFVTCFSFVFFPSIIPFFLLCRSHPITTPLPPPPSLSAAGQEDYRSRLNGECFQDLVCPEKCRCEGTVVDCSNLKLARVPAHIPEHTTDL